MSPERPHRFSALGLPSPAFTSGNMSPRSPGPMSPPMSAKSFGTFIDSEPSTPAYSPRMDYEWDSSTLVLLRPMSSSSEPSTPTEPAWDMMAPIKLSQRLPPKSSRPKNSAVTAHENSTGTSLSAPPVKKSRSAKPAKEARVIDLCQKENQAPQEEDLEDDEKKQLQEESATNASSAPLGKLASKMKLMLRRKNTNEKKKQKKEKDYYDVDRMDDVHWTEM